MIQWLSKSGIEYAKLRNRIRFYGKKSSLRGKELPHIVRKLFRFTKMSRKRNNKNRIKVSKRRTQVNRMRRTQVNKIKDLSQKKAVLATK